MIDGEDADEMNPIEPCHVQSPQTSECTILANSGYTARKTKNLSVIMSHESGEDDQSDECINNESEFVYGLETEHETLEMGKEMSRKRKSKKKEKKDRTGKERPQN